MVERNALNELIGQKSPPTVDLNKNPAVDSLKDLYGQIALIKRKADGKAAGIEKDDQGRITKELYYPENAKAADNPREWLEVAYTYGEDGELIYANYTLYDPTKPGSPKVASVGQDYNEGTIVIRDYGSGLVMVKIWDADRSGYDVEIRNKDGEPVVPPYFEPWV
jgi:hypothetical protein